jgi:hypothetical protein
MFDPVFATDTWLQAVRQWEVTRVLEDQFDWLAQYPWFPLQLLILWLLNARLLFRDYGAERLFWAERWHVQFGALFSSGLTLGTALFVWLLLDEPTRFYVESGKWNWPERLTLFPNSTEPAVVKAGRFLLFGFGVGLVLLLLTKLVQAVIQKRGERWRFLAARNWLWPGVLGFLAAPAFAYLLSLLDDAFGIRGRITGLTAFREVMQDAPPTVPYPMFPLPARWHPALPYQPTPSTDRELHAVAAYLVAVNVVMLVGMVVIAWVVRRRNRRLVAFGPAMLACHAVILFDLVIGWVAFHIQKQAVFVAAVLLVLVVWNLKVWTWKRYRFPGLEPEYDKPVSLAEYPKANPALLDDTDTLKAMVNGLKTPQTPKPKVVLVSVSGGGIRAAVWAATVLEGLDRDVPGLRHHVRLVSGASGGMVGAALWVGDFDTGPRPGTPDADGLGPLSRVAAEQALLPVVQTMILRDFALNLLLPPGMRSQVDRGWELETQWGLAAEKHFPAGDNPFARTFGGLKPLEQLGRRPSLVFTPTSIEDTRRVAVSNLDLDRFLAPVGPAGVTSRNGYELFRLFPAAVDRLTLGTAARMNATFPIVSPLVALPTDPPRRLMDAGLYDNYGIEFLGHWLLAHRDYLLAETDGVALIEIRAFPLCDRGLACRHADYPDMRAATEIPAEAVATVSGPFGALVRGRGDIGYHRNGTLVGAAADALGGHFRSFVFELDEDASLNWYLSSVEKKAIAGEWATMGPVVNQLRGWFV